LVDARTVVVTTVHERQVLAAGTVPTTAHDIHVDLVVTPDRVLRCARPKAWALPEIRWDELTDDKVTAIPLLTRMAGARAPGSTG
jgi:5-formyltetrahydrofolate cyclo-ligase